MAESKRQQKFSRQILKDLGEIFIRDQRHFFGNSLVSLTDTQVSPDLSFVKCFFSVLPVENAEEVLFNLNDKKGEIRRLLGNRIGKRVRIVPELAFFHDDTEERASRLDRLIDGLNIPPAPEEEEDL